MFEKRYAFRDWPNSEVPNVSAGVYAIWRSPDELVYVGMSGRSIEEAGSKAKYGLVTRLASHASGRLSGDQFCVYVANRFVIPSLVPNQLPLFASGDLRLDALTRAYVHERLEYAFTIVETARQAHDLERSGRSGEVFGVKPLLNPL